MGIPMGLPLFQAKQLCDTATVTFFSSNFTLYRDISSRVMRVLAEEVGECEIYSIDEAFFALPDTVTEDELRRLRSTIMQKVGIPVSIGVADSKTLAKIASKIAKKNDGVCIVDTHTWKETVSLDTSCGQVWNLGRATTAKLTDLGVKTAYDFMQLERSYIRKMFGLGAERTFDELHGVCIHSVDENSNDIRQSITSTRSFAKSTKKQIDVESAVSYHISCATKKLREKDLLCTRVFVLFGAGRHSDFSHYQSSFEITLDHPTQSTRELLQQALTVIGKHFDGQVPYKKAGVVLSGLIPASFASGSLFDTQTNTTKVLDELTDALQEKYGWNGLHVGSVLASRSQASAILRSNEYTTKWKDIPSVKAI